METGRADKIKGMAFKRSLKKQILLMGLLFLFLVLNISKGWSGEPGGWPPKGLSRRFEVTRDTGISSVSKERGGNSGGSWKLKLKGQQEYILFDIDPEELKGRLITGAILYFNTSISRNENILRAGVSSVASPWEEGRLFRYLPQPGASCFDQAIYQKKNWASYPGSSFMDVVFGHGHTIWKFADASLSDPEGWQGIAVDPDVVASRLAGISHGFCVADEVGSEWRWQDQKFSYFVFPNRYVYSSEHFSKKPWMKIWTDGEDQIPPDPIEFIKYFNEGLPPGQAVVEWKTPLDHGGGKTLGFNISYEINGEIKKIPRYLIPMAGTAGDPVLMHIQDMGLPPGQSIGLIMQSVDSAGNIGKTTKKKIVTASIKKNELTNGDKSVYFSMKAAASDIPITDIKVSVIDLLDKINPVSGNFLRPKSEDYKKVNHLFSAAEKKIHLQSARNETVCFQVNLKENIDQANAKFMFPDDPELDPVIFRAGYVDVKKGRKIYQLPDPLLPLSNSEAVNLKKNQSFICEIFVPHGTEAEKKYGQLVVDYGKETIVFDLELDVYNFTLPDKLSFIPEMNAYGTAHPYQGYAYYRLAHEHRTCLNRLPYDWTGTPSFAPDVKDNVFDWQNWDEKIGPLLDGSAFRKMRRKNEPVDVFYLPFNENWPVNIFEHFNPSYWADEAFSKAYKKQLGNGFKAFADHFYERKWFGPIFQFYLNNKISYRKKNRLSTGPWLFDEPVNTQDFWALRWYGQLWKDSLANSVDKGLKMWFRADISYSEFGRNILWGITDIEYLGGNNKQKTRMINDRKILNGDVCFSEYGSANRIDESNVNIPIWCLSAWFNGANGVLPWQTMGVEESWKTADQNAIFYPHPKGPFPSIRLKAFMAGQQLVEYCTMTCELYGISRQELKAVYDKMVEDNGGVVDPALIWAFKNRLGKMISDKAPPYRRSWVNWEHRYPGTASPVALGSVTPAPTVKSISPDCYDFSYQSIAQ